MGGFPGQWMQVKGFQQAVKNGVGEAFTQGHKWQRRFWAYLIEDQGDFNRHAHYIHWNPLKHGKVKRVGDWPYSSFHRYVEQGFYSENWGNDEKFEINGSEKRERCASLRRQHPICVPYRVGIRYRKGFQEATKFEKYEMLKEILHATKAKQWGVDKVKFLPCDK